jgi:hypothetical protein
MMIIKVFDSAGTVLAVWLFMLSIFVSTESWAQKVSEAGNPIIPVHINETVIQAEVVASMNKIYLGLGGRRQLAPGSGMLFIMPALAVQEFCMRGMLIPIDIIWIAQGRIIGFHQKVSPKNPGNFTSPEPADLVLEAPAGFVAANGLKIGDRLRRHH